MTNSHIKGALLEFIVRNILRNSGFVNVKEDKLYTFRSRGLFFVNGKGAAHDADVFVNPPVQIPFVYPTQLIFECKGYSKPIGLPIIRNALGFRNDINDFEIVTKKYIMDRQNDRRKYCAIETRKRFMYQVGIASLYGFTIPAIEFATNNKIPLLSLDLFLSRSIIDKFDLISNYLSENPASKEIYGSLKNRDTDINFSDIINLPEQDIKRNSILSFFEDIGNIINRFSIGLLETGEILFIQFPDAMNKNTLFNANKISIKIHYNVENPTLWKLSFLEEKENNDEIQEIYGNFYLPKNIITNWLQYNFDNISALRIKSDYFPKLFLFNGNLENPLKVVNINKKWLEEAENELKNRGERDITYNNDIEDDENIE